MLAAVLEFGLWHSWSMSPVSARRGRKHVKKDLRLLGEANFIERDLSQRITIDSKYDLACCLEVAEHRSPNVLVLVEDLTKLAPVVLFSAAIPGQVVTITMKCGSTTGRGCSQRMVLEPWIMSDQ